MDNYIEQAVEAVQWLNEYIIDATNAFFTMKTNGSEIAIDFNEINLYYSENDDLSYDNDTKEYTILEYCKLKFEELKKEINSLTFIN